jgi:hypothetical protein
MISKLPTSLLSLYLALGLSGCGPLLGTIGFSRGLPVGHTDWAYEPTGKTLLIHIQPGGATSGSEEYGYRASLSGAEVHIRGYARGTFGGIPLQVDRSVTIPNVPAGQYDVYDDVAGKKAGRNDTSIGHGELQGDLL